MDFLKYNNNYFSYNIVFIDVHVTFTPMNKINIKWQILSVICKCTDIKLRSFTCHCSGQPDLPLHLTFDIQCLFSLEEYKTDHSFFLYEYYWCNDSESNKYVYKNSEQFLPSSKKNADASRPSIFSVSFSIFSLRKLFCCLSEWITRLLRHESSRSSENALPTMLNSSSFFIAGSKHAYCQKIQKEMI